MPPRPENPTDALEVLMPDEPLPERIVWIAATVLAGVALIGLVMGLRQTPVGGRSGFDFSIADSPAVASASASSAKPLTGDKWSTLSGPQIAAPETPKPEAPPPSAQAPAARSAASNAAPPDTAPPPEAPPPAPPSAPTQSAPPANSAQPDSMQNYY